MGDRTISLADSGASQTRFMSHALVNLNDRDKRSALTITHACTAGDTGVCSVTSGDSGVTGAFKTAVDGTQYSVGDVVLVTSLPPAGTDKSPNEGLHRVTATATASVTLKRVDGGPTTVTSSGVDANKYGNIVITRVST